MKIFNIFKKSQGSSDSGSSGSPTSRNRDFNFSPSQSSSPARCVVTGSKPRTKTVSTAKIIRVCGADSQEDIERINALQSEVVNDSTDTSFEDDEFCAAHSCGNIDNFSKGFDTFKFTRPEGRNSTCVYIEHRDARYTEDRRKSDSSCPTTDTDHSYESRSTSAFPSGVSTPGTPQHSPPVQTGPTPFAAHPLPTPPSSPKRGSRPLRTRAGGAVPQPLPLPSRGVCVYDLEAEQRRGSPLLSPCSSPLRPSSSPRLSPRMSSPLRSPQWSPRESYCLRWEKLQELGRGSFATVYQGLDKDDGSFFAVKVIHDSSVSRKETEQEVGVLSKLDHPNIVRYYGTGIESNGEVCIFLELMTTSLKSVLNRLGKGFEESTIRQYTRQILNGLVYLHEHNTIHRDIKCANILVNASGQVKLADFGVAKQTPTASSLKGTPIYMAPEIINPNTSSRSYGTPVDIWSLGCTVLEMADGKPPWGDMPGFAFYFKLSKGQAPPVPEHLSPAAKDFIQSCLRFKPEERPTAAKLLQHRFLVDPPCASPRNSPLASTVCPRALAAAIASSSSSSSPAAATAASSTGVSHQDFFLVDGVRRNGNINLVSRDEHISALIYRTRSEPQKLIFKPSARQQDLEDVQAVLM